MSAKTATLRPAGAGPAGSVTPWPTARPRLFLVSGGAGQERETWASGLASLGAGLAGASVTATQPAPDFATFGGLRSLLAAIDAAGGEAAASIREEHRDTFEALDGQAGADQVRASRLAETITFAVTRRISRESHHSALLIDRLVDYLLDVLRRCPAFATGLTVVVPDLPRWDRPSIRCLCRLAKRLDAGDRVALVAFGWAPVELPTPAPHDVAGRVTWARARFLLRIACEPELAVLPLGPDEREEWPPPEVAADFSTALLDVGNALAFQNYERVYLLCDALLRRGTEPEDEARVRRLVGIANAQLGDFTESERELRRACDLSRIPEYRAHLHYLMGLLKTKRVYDLGDADVRYDAGLAALEDADGAGADAGIERAWLLNGQALVLSLRAKQAEADDRTRLLERAFALEFEAHRLVRDMAGPAASYLRHNLFANLTFLLEISRRHPEAIDFWRRALERYLEANSPGFTAVYEGRLGMLLFKAGRHDEAIDTLWRVRDLCRVTRDRFYEEKVYLALGHALHGSGRTAEALDAYREGARISVDMRTPDAYADHARGALVCLAAAGDGDGFERLVAQLAGMEPTAAIAEAIRGTPADLPPAERLAAAGVRQPVPSPKMPAYIPSVDLEGAPARDLNRYLVSEGGPFL